MHLRTVEVSDELPLLASVVWGTLGHDDDSENFRSVEAPQGTQADKAPNLQ